MKDEGQIAGAPKTFSIVTLGCKVNQCESESIAASLEKSGWAMAAQTDSADVCIVNTCAVTHKAAMQSRQAIRHFRKAHPDAWIIATGCYAQTDPSALNRITELDAVYDNVQKAYLPDILTRLSNGQTGDLPQTNQTGCEVNNLPLSKKTRTRPFIKIQDGCNAFCSYCIVPHARGRSRSLSPDRILELISDYDKAQYPEVVLTGIHIGQYGLDFDPPTSLSQLLHTIQNSGVHLRVRLSSIEPMELSDDIIDLAATSHRLCHHFHLPLQSGDNGILKRMHRPYDRDCFADRVLAVHSRLPHAAIGTDVMAGFPGETDAAFDQTVELIDRLPLTYLHVFPFSPRKGTPAFQYPDTVPDGVIKERCRILRQLGMNKKIAFMKSQIGQVLHAVIETGRDTATGLLKGVTSNYIQIMISGDDCLQNTLVPVHPEKLGDGAYLIGKTTESRLF